MEIETIGLVLGTFIGTIIYRIIKDVLLGW